MVNCGCGNQIEPMRLEVLPDTQICMACAKQVKDKGVIGFMVFTEGKTGPTLMMVDANNSEAVRLAGNANARMRRGDRRSPV